MLFACDMSPPSDVGAAARLVLSDFLVNGVREKFSGGAARIYRPGVEFRIRKLKGAGQQKSSKKEIVTRLD